MYKDFLPTDELFSKREKLAYFVGLLELML